MFPNIDAGFDALEYSFAPGGYVSQVSLTLAERALWCSVIERAFIDIGMITDNRGMSDAIRDGTSQASKSARNWLLDGREDFTLVCTLAGVCPQVIRRAAVGFLMGAV